MAAGESDCSKKHPFKCVPLRGIHGRITASLLRTESTLIFFFSFSFLSSTPYGQANRIQSRRRVYLLLIVFFSLLSLRWYIHLALLCLSPILLLVYYPQTSTASLSDSTHSPLIPFPTDRPDSYCGCHYHCDDNCDSHCYCYRYSPVVPLGAESQPSSPNASAPRLYMKCRLDHFSFLP